MNKIPIEKFGKDHWSLLAYIETRCVDNQRELDLRHLRCNIKTHPSVALPQHNLEPGVSSLYYPYGTRLNDATVVDEHDDHDCIEDLVETDLVEVQGTGIRPICTMTERGYQFVAALRKHKCEGGSCGTFRI